MGRGAVVVVPLFVSVAVSVSSYENDVLALVLLVFAGLWLVARVLRGSDRLALRFPLLLGVRYASRPSLQEELFDLANAILRCDPSVDPSFPELEPTSPLGRLYSMTQTIKMISGWSRWNLIRRWRRRRRSYTPRLHERFQRALEALAAEGITDSSLTHLAMQNTIPPEQRATVAGTLAHMGDKLAGRAEAL